MKSTAKETLLRFEKKVREEGSVLYQAAFDGTKLMNAVARHQCLPYDKFPNLVVLSAGSSGRLDSGGFGDFDLVVATRDAEHPGDLPTEHMEYLEQFLSAPIQLPRSPIPWSATATAQRVRIESDEDLLFFGGKAQPGRILEAEFIAGSPSLEGLLRERVATAVFQYSNRVLDDLRDQRRTHRKATETGQWSYKGSTVPQFERDPGKVEFSPQDGKWGLKFNYLRFFQTVMNVELVTALSSQESRVNMLARMPRGFEERVVLLLANECVNRIDDVMEVAVSYMHAAGVQAALKFRYYSQFEPAPVVQDLDTHLLERLDAAVKLCKGADLLKQSPPLDFLTVATSDFNPSA